jgi:phage-related protein
MAAGEELPPVVAQLIGETADMVREFRAAAQAVRDMTAPSLEAAEATRDLDGRARDAALSVSEEGSRLAELRDREVEAAAAAQGAAEEMGHVRDEAAEAAASVHELGTQAGEAAGKLDLMALSGASTFSSLGGLVGIIGAVVVAAAAVAPAALAAGLGMAAFGAFAIPTLKSVFGALADTRAQLAKLPQPIQAAVRELKSLEAEFGSIAKAFQPQVIGLFSQALGIATSLLPRLIPLAQAGAQAVGLLLTALNRGVTSSGFASFLQLMTRMVVPATQAIVRLAGVLTGVLGQALTQLAPLSVPFINFVSVLASALGGPLVAGLHVVIGLFLGLATAITPLLPGLSKIATMLVNDIGSSFQSFVPILQQVVQVMGGALIQVLQSLEPILANALTPNSPFMLALQQLPGLLHLILPLITGFARVFADPHVAQFAVMVLSVAVAFKAVVGVLGLARAGFAALTAVMEVNPIILILTAIALLVVGLIYLWDHCAAFREFWEAAWRGVQAAALDAWDFIDGNVIKPLMAGIDALAGFVRSHWKVLAVILGTMLLGPVGALVAFLAEHWKTVAADAEKAARAIAAPFEAMWRSLTAWWRSYGGEVMEIWHAIWAYESAVTRTEVRVIEVLVEALARYFAAAWDLIAGITRGTWDVIYGIVRGVLGVMAALIRAELTFIADIARLMWAAVVLVTRVAWTVMSAVVKVAWDMIAAAVRIGWDVLVGIFDVMLDLVTGHWSKAWRDVQQVFGQVWNAIRSSAGQEFNAIRSGLEGLLGAVRSYLGTVLAVFERVPGQVMSALSGLVGSLFSLGQNIIGGLLAGIRSAVGGLLSSVAGIGHDISSTFAAAVHALSPSRVFMEHGMNIVRGLILGVQSLAPQLMASISGLARSASAAARVAVAAMPAGGLPPLALAGGGIQPGVLRPAGGAALAAAGAPGGNLVVNVDGKQLLSISKAQLYQYNVRNSGQVTGVLKPA